MSESSKSRKINNLLRKIFELETTYFYAKNFTQEDQNLIIIEVTRMLEFIKIHSAKATVYQPKID